MSKNKVSPVSSRSQARSSSHSTATVLLGFDDEQRPNIRYYSASPDGSDLSSSLRSRPASPSLELLEDAPHSGSSDDVIFVEHNPAMARTASAMSQASTGSAAAAAALTPAGSHSQAASISPARAIAPLPHGLPAKPNEAVIAASGSPVKVCQLTFPYSYLLS